MRIGILDQTTRGWSAGESFTRMMLACIELAVRGDGSEVVFLSQSEGEWANHSFPRIQLGEHLNCARWREAVKKAGLDVILPVRNHLIFDIDVPVVGWIPDLQHFQLPELFDAKDIEQRNMLLTELAVASDIVLLSSESAAKDYAEFAPLFADKARVARFPSLLWSAELPDPRPVLSGYHLPSKFVLVANQFWKHKNHRILPEALSVLKKRGCALNLVVTGLPCDYRDPENTALSIFFQNCARYDVMNSIRFLGNVPYRDLMALMRAASGVIQPSLFEGWSTSIEDCKALGKQLVCSDIPVHREQAPVGALFFNPLDVESLVEILKNSYESWTPAYDCEEEGTALADARTRARVYGARLLDLAREAAEIGGAREKPIRAWATVGASDLKCDETEGWRMARCVEEQTEYIRELEQACEQRLTGMKELQMECTRLRQRTKDLSTPWRLLIDRLARYRAES